MTRAAVVAAARSMLGVPYHLKGSTPVGADCFGLLVYVLRVTGMEIPGFETTDYSPGIIPHFDRYLDRIDRSALALGDVVVQGAGLAQHLGILGDYRHGGFSMIHAEGVRYHACVEHRLWLDGPLKFMGAYRIPGIA